MADGGGKKLEFCKIECIWDYCKLHLVLSVRKIYKNRGK